MDTFADYLVGIENPDHRSRTESVLRWVLEEFPDLKPRVAWNQPMFTDHGTFIIGFSVAKKHMAAAPEGKGIEHFSAELDKAGIDHGTRFIRFPWEIPLDYDLLKRIIAYNIDDKKDCTTFWRK